MNGADGSSGEVVISGPAKCDIIDDGGVAGATALLLPVSLSAADPATATAPFFPFCLLAGLAVPDDSLLLGLIGRPVNGSSAICDDLGMAMDGRVGGADAIAVVEAGSGRAPLPFAM
jgi:hypothetical protein